MNAVRIAPIVMFILVACLLTWLIKNLGIVKRSADGWALGILTAETATLLLPSIFDSFLWYDSAATGYMSIIMGLLVINLCLIFIQKKPKLITEVAAYIVAALSSTFSEPTAMFMIAGLGLASLVAILKKEKKVYRFTILFCVAMIVGFLVLYFSPGSIERRATAMPAEFSMGWVFGKSFSNIVGNTVRYTTVWEAGLMLITGVYAAAIVQLNKYWKKHLKLLLTVGMVMLIVLTYGVICINNYAQDYIPYRIYTLPTFGAVVALEIIMVALKNMLPAHMAVSMGMRTVAGILIVVISLGTLLSASGYITKLALRRQLVNYRDTYTAKQRDEGNEIIYLIEAPNLVLGNAEDIYYYYPEDGSEQIIWVGKNYASYMNVADKELVLIAAPEMYYY